jgi:hypothetical protein
MSNMLLMNRALWNPNTGFLTIPVRLVDKAKMEIIRSVPLSKLVDLFDVGGEMYRDVNQLIEALSRKDLSIEIRQRLVDLVDDALLVGGHDGEFPHVSMVEFLGDRLRANMRILRAVVQHRPEEESEIDELWQVVTSWYDTYGDQNDIDNDVLETMWEEPGHHRDLILARLVDHALQRFWLPLVFVAGKGHRLESVFCDVFRMIERLRREREPVPYDHVKEIIGFFQSQGVKITHATEQAMLKGIQYRRFVHSIIHSFLSYLDAASSTKNRKPEPKPEEDEKESEQLRLMRQQRARESEERTLRREALQMVDIVGYCRCWRCHRYSKKVPSDQAYVVVKCTAGCRFMYHQGCWRHIRSRCADWKAGATCLTDCCEGRVLSVTLHEDCKTERLLTGAVASPKPSNAAPPPRSPIPRSSSGSHSSDNENKEVQRPNRKARRRPKPVLQEVRRPMSPRNAPLVPLPLNRDEGEFTVSKKKKKRSKARKRSGQRKPIHLDEFQAVVKAAQDKPVPEEMEAKHSVQSSK